eukprot:scaffold241495_cov20-Tisochrysis_lutea.AAC.2
MSRRNSPHPCVRYQQAQGPLAAAVQGRMRQAGFSHYGVRWRTISSTCKGCGFIFNNQLGPKMQPHAAKGQQTLFNMGCSKQKHEGDGPPRKFCCCHCRHPLPLPLERPQILDLVQATPP